MNFHPYPDGLQTDAIKYLADLFLKREPFDKAVLGKAVYSVQGVLQKFILGEPGEEPPIMPAMAQMECTITAEEVTAQHVADTLTALLPKDKRSKAQQGIFSGIGNRFLLLALQRILTSLLSGIDGADEIIDGVISFLKDIIAG